MDPIECPICNTKVSKEKIEKHVNNCLQFPKEKPATRRASRSPSNFEGFFVKKSKRKRPKSPEDTTKKQCVDDSIVVNNEHQVLGTATVIPDSPPLPSVDTQCVIIDPECTIIVDPECSIIVDKITIPPPILQGSFQETLLKWSQGNGTSPSISDKKSKIITTTKQKEKKDIRYIQKEHSKNFTDIGEKEKINSVQVQHKKQQEITLGKTPLADQMRPTDFDHYFGQEAVSSSKVLKDLFYNKIIPSLLLWGPPGCGKTSLAHVIAQKCKESKQYRFVTLSATMAGVNDVKQAVKVAKNESQLTKRQTVLFIDEVHRFNKLQQDSFLPHVEDGTIVLIGATTENPSFHLNNALLSRCKLVVLSKLSSDDIHKILKNAVKLLGGSELEANEKRNQLEEAHNKFLLDSGVLKTISDCAGGDARVALNTLEHLLLAKLGCHHKSSASKHEDNGLCIISVEDIKEELRQGYVNYDRNGDEHYDIISALHKSIRGGDENAAIYWLARMLEGGESPLYIARRLVRIASEDIGLADPLALNQAVSAYQACHFIGMPECDLILAQAATYLARAPKSIEVCEAYSKAKQLVRTWKGAQPNVPLHLRNAPTRVMKQLGYGKGYKYTPKCQDDPRQEYLPSELTDTMFFENVNST